MPAVLRPIPGLLFCLAAWVSVGAAPAHADTVRIAVLAFQGSERAAKDFEPTVVGRDNHLGRWSDKHDGRW